MSDQAIFYVYMLLRPWDGTPFYVGKGKGNRAQHHERYARKRAHKNIIVQRIFDKAEKAGQKVVLEILNSNLTEDEAFALEIATIQMFERKSDGGCLANLTLGGEGPTGYKFDAALVARMTEAKRGQKRGPETGQAISLAKTGKPRFDLRGKSHTPEHNAKIGASNVGKNVGRRHSKATRAKMSASRTGVKLGPYSAERRQKTREAWARWRERNGRPALCL